MTNAVMEMKTNHKILSASADDGTAGAACRCRAIQTAGPIAKVFSGDTSVAGFYIRGGVSKLYLYGSPEVGMIELALAFALVLCVGVICANFILLLSPIPFRGGLAGASMLATCGGSFSSHYWHYGANFSHVYFVPCIVGACAVVMIAALMSPPRSEFVHPH